MSYPNFQEFASYTSRSTNIGFLMYQKKCLNAGAEWILALWNFGSTAKKCASARVWEKTWETQVSWSTNIGFLNLFSYFEQHSSNLSIKDECLGCPQFLKSVERPHFLKNSIWLLNIVYWFHYFQQARHLGVMGNTLVSNSKAAGLNPAGVKILFFLFFALNTSQ